MHALDMQLQRELLEMQNEVELDRLEQQMEMEAAMGGQGEGASPQQPGGEEEFLGGEQPPDMFGEGGSPKLNPAEGEMSPATFNPGDNAEGAGNPFMGETQ
jgi:hypothetical protein